MLDFPSPLSDDAAESPAPPPQVEPAPPPVAEPQAPPAPGEQEPVLAPPPPEVPQRRSWRQWLATTSIRCYLSSFGLSLAIHLAVLLVLSIVYMTLQRPPTLGLVISMANVVDDEPLTMIEIEPTQILPGEVAPDVLEAYEKSTTVEVPQVDDLIAGEPEPAGDSYHKPDEGILRPETLLMGRPGTGGGLEGRSDEVRAALVGPRGGTPASEAAVAKGLAWLAAHQRPNGSWNFDHRSDLCDGLCRDPGTATTTTGATALVLLPFLGAGYTHEKGPYQETVKKGLYYLQGQMRQTPHGGDFMQGTMYAQGMTAIAFCEAYAMSGDKDLRPFAQEAIDFICYAQHTAGGWRYFPHQPGDTTVFGWQFMALKSASLAKLEVPSPVIDGAMRYLDSVQTENGAKYGYLHAGSDPTPTAVGLLSRMYLGWPQDHPSLKKGVEHLAKIGPSKEDMYFNYYATQVLHHYDGPQWEPWNTNLREYLIKTQATTGHENGSWFFPDKHGLSGGRLYTTAMCVMILEVYYRHMPIYGDRSVNEGF